MDFSIKYFKDYISFHVDDSHPVKELLPHHCEEADVEEEEIRRALAHPISSPCLSEIVKAGEKVVIITSDVTRPVPRAFMASCPLCPVRVGSCGRPRGRYHRRLCAGVPSPSDGRGTRAPRR